MKRKFLVQVRASKKDPSFAEQMVCGEVPFLQYFEDAGIRTLREDLVTSCHGNTSRAFDHAMKLAALSHTHSVVSIQAGGLYFALPSLMAAIAPTVTIISVPLDGGESGLDAFLAPRVPSGHAAIGGVSIANYSCAARAAQDWLSNKIEGVYLWNGKLEEHLKKLGVPVLGSAKDGEQCDGLVVGCLDMRVADFEHFDDFGSSGIYTAEKSSECGHSAGLMNLSGIMKQSVYARGEANVAMLAAKVVGMHNPEVRERILAARDRKKNSYDRRDLSFDEFTGD